MTEVTKEMILDYLIKKGGVVKNVDLVRHFRKYLQVENSALKGKKIGHALLTVVDTGSLPPTAALSTISDLVWVLYSLVCQEGNDFVDTSA